MAMTAAAATKTVADITQADWDSVVTAINTISQQAYHINDKVRNLEYRIDNFVPTTMVTTVVPPAPKYVWAAVVVGAAAIGWMAYKELRKPEQPLQAPSA